MIFLILKICDEREREREMYFLSLKEEVSLYQKCCDSLEWREKVNKHDTKGFFGFSKYFFCSLSINEHIFICAKGLVLEMSYLHT